MTTFEFGNVTWFDINSPRREDVRNLVLQYDVHPDIAEELISSSSLPQYRRADSTIFLSLFFPALKHTHNDDVQEVDFLLKDNIIITAHYDSIDALHKIKKEFEVEQIIRPNKEHFDAFPLFDDIVRKLYKSLRHEIEFVLSDIKRIETLIFSGKERSMVEEISQRSTALLSIIRTLSLNYAAIESLVLDLKDTRKDIDLFIQSVEINHQRTLRLARDTMSALKELRETNALLVTIHQNDILKNLAALSFVCFPLALLASIFGMNTQHTPIIGSPHDFWIVIGSMGVLTSLFFLYFHRKRWL